MKEVVKRDLVLKTDPYTQEQYWGMGTRIVKKPEEEDRVNAVLDILKGTITAEEVKKMYDITSINSIYTWIGKYVSQEKTLSLQDNPESDEDMANKSKDDQIRELKAKLKQAEKKAEFEALRAHAYDKMIDLAEEKFNIPIRKKSGTKQ